VQRGSNSIGVRRYNERLVLATVRRLKGASKADIAKLTGLSPQAAVRLVDSLAGIGRLVPVGRRTGGVGQPATIYGINENSGCTIGVEVARDHLTCTLMDFNGAVLSSWSRDHAFPRPEQVIDDIASFAATRLATIPRAQQEGFLGTGIAMPWFIGEWRDELGLREGAETGWHGAATASLFEEHIEGQIFFENDGNAGALAELFCGAGVGLTSFLYIHIGRFVGGGLVLGGQLHQGRHGNAAALASMPIPGPAGFDVLLHRASLYAVEKQLRPNIDEANIAEWLTACADAVAFMAIGANSLLDLEGMVFGGALPDDLLDRLIEQIAASMAQNAPRDFFQPILTKGSIGELAPAQGAGLLPLFATYSPDLDSLMK
jgi:predicted NBD/HSP70 family sugar kinase